MPLSKADFERIEDWRNEAALLAAPAAAGIFLVEFAAGQPYLGKTANLRRRLRRLLCPRDGSGSRLTLREAAAGVLYRRTGSRFESDLLLYRAVKAYRPGDSRDYLKLRRPTFVKVLLGNRYPRTCLTQGLTGGRSLFFGPFPSRSVAERFQSAFLDLFLVRRCTENLEPSPDHPGCIWGEMEMCLRPCQAACGDRDYAAEVERMTLFLRTGGESLLRELESARDSASAAMEFEAAERHHRALGKAKEALRQRDGLAREVSRQNGIVLQRSAESDCLDLTPLFRGSLQESLRLRWEPGAGPAAARIAAAIRETVRPEQWSEGRPAEKSDHLALLQRWHGSSFRRGEYVPVRDFADLPSRKLANAALRVASAQDRSPGSTRTDTGTAVKLG